MYIHVGIAAKDSAAKARAVPSTQSDSQGIQQAGQGFFSRHAAPTCALYHPQHWCGMGEMQHLHSHPTASLHLQHSFYVICERREEVLLLQQSISRLH